MLRVLDVRDGVPLVEIDGEWASLPLEVGERLRYRARDGTDVVTSPIATVPELAGYYVPSGGRTYTSFRIRFEAREMIPLDVILRRIDR
jgi:hypothetical protein